MASMVAVEPAVEAGVQAVQMVQTIARGTQAVTQAAAAGGHAAAGGAQVAALTSAQVKEIEAVTRILVNCGIEAVEAGQIATQAVVEVAAEMAAGTTTLRGVQTAAAGMSTVGKVFAIGGGVLAIVSSGVIIGFAIHSLVNGHPTAITVNSLKAQMERKIVNTVKCKAREGTCPQLANAAQVALRDYSGAIASLKELLSSISVHNGWTQGSQMAGAGLGIASGILWILAVPTLGATTIPAAITSGVSAATAGGVFIGDLARSKEFRGRTERISNMFRASEVEFNSWFGAQHLADHIIKIRGRIPAHITKAKERLAYLEDKFQPLGEVTSVCEQSWLTMSRDRLIAEIKGEVFDRCHRQDKLPLIAVNDANELLGMATVQCGPLSVDLSVNVASVLHVRKLHDSAKGVAQTLYTLAFQAVAGKEGIEGIFVSNAARTLPEKKANVKGMLFAAGVCGYTKILNVGTAESWKRRELATNRDGNIDVEAVDTFLFTRP